MSTRMKGRREERQKRRRDKTLFLYSVPEKEVKHLTAYKTSGKTEEEVVHAKKFFFPKDVHPSSKF